MTTPHRSTEPSLPLAVLDFVGIEYGEPAHDAIAGAVEVAQAVEDAGYRRYWVSEHHNMRSLACSAPEILIAHLGAKTSRIRVGAAGIMLPNHAPFKVAETFRTLLAMYPDRIDLGLGRAPGTDQAAAFALRRNLDCDPNSFPRDVVELMNYFKPAEPGQRVRAIPGEGLDIPVWILGSSLFGAQLAAMLGLPYAFASHFAPQQMMEAIQVYRSTFRPSAQLEKPYVMLGFNAFAADSDEEGALLATSVQQAFVALRTGQPTALKPPLRDYAQSLPPGQRATLDQLLSCSAIGSPATVRAAIHSFVERTGADELMITSQIHDHEARLRSYEIVAECIADG
jgi:luciferase family oxidoreductase group 1